MTRTLGSRLSKLAMLAVLVPAIGCASSATDKEEATLPEGTGGPVWIDQPQSQFDDGSEVWIYAVGQAVHDPNRAAQANKAKQRARTDIARTLQVSVQSMAEDYQNTNRDFYDMDGASSVEYYEEISRQVTDVTLSGSRVIDSWRDPSNGDYYVLLGMPLDNSFFDAYMKSSEEAYARWAQREMIKAQKEEYSDKLDAQLDKAKNMSKDQLKELLKLDQ